MKKIIKENWLMISILSIAFLVALAAIYYFLFFLPRQQRQNNLVKQQLQAQAANIALQEDCANQAQKFFTTNGDTEASGDPYLYYENHYNSQLNKCFILIIGGSASKSYTGLDLYDAIQQKHYASYFGSNICDLTAAEDDAGCNQNSGSIWFDGDDTKTADIQINDAGNTEKEFMQHVEPFMSN